MKLIAPKKLMESVFPTVINGGIFNASSLDLQFARTKTLDPRVTFTRASSGTYVGSDGLIKTATTNLLTYSEQFDNAIWVAANGASKGSANSQIAPDGTTTADSLTLGSQADSVIYHNTNPAAGTYTLSIYVKVLSGTSTFRISVYQTSGTALYSNDLTATTQWQKFSYTFTAATTFYPRPLTVSSSFTGGTFIAWGAQLEQSSTVGEYIPTTSTINSAPRFDHNPTTGESLGLLVEEQRTNLITYSQALNNAAWGVTGSGATLTATTDTNAPDGSLTAWTLTSSGAAAQIQNSITGTSGATYTGSFWIRRRSGTGIVNIRVSENTNIALAGVSSSWQRFFYTATSTSTTIRLGVNLSGTSDSVDLWGAQLEAGSFPTSYIPTTTAAVTRSADVTSITGSNFSSWYRQDEGTVFADLVTASRGYNSYPRLVGILGNDINATNEFSIYTRNIGTSDDYKLFGVVTDGTTAGDFNPPAFAPVGSGKVALAAKVNDGAMSVNGLALQADNSLGMPAATQMLLFSNARYQPRTSGTIRRLTYWPQRLANATLQEITR